MLRDKRHRAAEAFLTANGKNIGKHPPIDLDISFGGWSVLLLAPVVTIVAATFAAEPLVPPWTQTLMGNAR